MSKPVIIASHDDLLMQSICISIDVMKLRRYLAAKHGMRKLCRPLRDVMRSVVELQRKLGVDVPK